MATRSTEELILEACLREVQAPKPGNVHPGASFCDLTCEDFIRSAHAVAPVLARAGELGIGQAILHAVQATRRVVATNTNLGMILLLTPLAAIPRDRSLVDGIEPILAALTRDDAVAVYEAIRLSMPGAMGDVPEGDLAVGPTGTLREMMALAADRDSIATEYARGFPIVLQCGLPILARRWRDDAWEEAVVGLHLELMAAIPDTLIARKCGPEVARESADRATRVLDAGWPIDPHGRRLCKELDLWLRADGHRRNPGTTADLVAASVFAFFREHRG
ncbi:MAG: triphosphoribosyl-dephospho-CoA synthase [Planctomycetota bacterium]|nr:triphosphoribosyl-dephospho-CoA synthase [Planctomycetota bacterium]